MVDLAYYKRINSQFLQQVGIIDCVERLEGLGLVARDISGIFWSRDLDHLTRVVNNHKDLHIGTNLEVGHSVNRIVQGKHKYWLADGDNDPNLELYLPPEIVNHLFAELNHFIRGMNLDF